MSAVQQLYRMHLNIVNIYGVSSRDFYPQHIDIYSVDLRNFRISSITTLQQGIYIHYVSKKNRILKII